MYVCTNIGRHLKTNILTQGADSQVEAGSGDLVPVDVSPPQGPEAGDGPVLGVVPRVIFGRSKRVLFFLYRHRFNYDEMINLKLIIFYVDYRNGVSCFIFSYFFCGDL
jgi:hypothetical protein